MNRLIDKGMIIDIDHMGCSTRMDTLDILELRQYGGVVSSHSWMEDNAQTDGDVFASIQYPFTSVDGKVTFTPPNTGNRHFDYASEGVANYGTMAEWVENLRQVDARYPDDDLMGIFMNSAESFLQMRERTEAMAVE